MKRILAIVVALSCILIITSVTCESLDLAEYSDDDLLLLQTLVNAEVESRGIAGNKVNILPEGRYTVGVDIPAGSFLFRQIPGDSYIPIIYVYNSDDLENAAFTISPRGQAQILHIRESQILVITWTQVAVTKTTDLELEW